MPIPLTLKFRFQNHEISIRKRAAIMRSEMDSCVEKAKTTVLNDHLNQNKQNENRLSSEKTI